MQIFTVGEYDAKREYSEKVLELIDAVERSNCENPLDTLRELVKMDNEIFTHMVNLLLEKQAGDFPG